MLNKTWNRILFCIVSLFVGLHAFAAKEQVIASLHGSNIVQTPGGSPYSLMAEDQQYGYMVSNLSGWNCKFGVKRCASKVILRFDQSQWALSSAFSLDVKYDVALYDLSSNTTPYATFTDQHAVIDYQVSGANYTDKFVKTYEGAYRVELKVKTVSFNTSSTAIPSAYDHDIYLDVIQETERYYNLFYNPLQPCISTLIPKATVSSAFANAASVSQAALVPYKNQLPVFWNYVQGAESYDVEWLFVDIGTGLFSAVYNINFDNATRVNTSANHYEIPVAYPKGIILYRVRPIGISSTAPYLARTEGDWSVSGTNTSNIVNPAGNSYRVDFDGLDKYYNWQYSAAFAEEGKRKEVISYFDGSLRNRQTATIINSDNNAVIAETKYDFQGRPTVQMLPTPYANSGIQYYSNFNPNFTKENFDVDGNFPVATATDPLTDATSAYYGSNTAATGTDAYVPDAQGVPYTQTLYKKDGTGRIAAQSGVGPTHMLGSGHDTRYFYGTPGGQEELDRLFGDEVGNVSHYKKNLMVDANGQVSVTYLDQEGRTIATALAGTAPSNLLDLDNKPAAETITVDMLSGKNNISGNTRSSTTTFLTSAPNTAYTFTYTLNQDQACYTLDPTKAVPCTICKTCVFDLEIKVTDQNGNPVTGVTVLGQSYYNGAAPTTTCYNSSSAPPTSSPVKCDHISSANYTLSVTFADIGAYSIEKTLKIDQGQLDSDVSDFGVALQTSPCGPLTTPTSTVPCNDCSYLCNQQFGVYGPSFVTPTTLPVPAPVVTTDSYGTLISSMPSGSQAAAQTQANADYAACIRVCNDGISVNIPDECTLKASLLARDMSPGGQYFDNLQDLSYTCSPNLSCSPDNPSYNQSTCINSWLTANINGVYSSFWTDFQSYLSATASTSPCHLTITGASDLAKWNWVRGNWQSCFSDFLIKYHPEYCNYSFYCGNTVFCGTTGDGAPTVAITFTTATDGSITYGPTSIVTMQHSNLYDKEFKADHTLAFANPLAFSVTGGTTPKNYVSPLNTSSYAPISSVSGPSRFLDPIFDPVCSKFITVRCSTSSTPSPIADMMLNYLQGFYVANATLTPFNMSIWYVLDDPDNINGIATGNTISSADAHVLTAGTVLDQQTVDFIRSFHGSGGIIASSSKYDVFKSVYEGYKQFILYGLLNTAYNCGSSTFATAYTASSALPSDGSNKELTPCTTGGGNTLPHATIRFPKNDIFEAMLSSCPSFAPSGMQTAVAQFTTDAASGDANSACTGNAGNWIQQITQAIQACNPATGTALYTFIHNTDNANAMQTMLDHMRLDMISICEHSYDPATFPQGQSTMAGLSTSYTLTSDGTATHITSFQDVYSHYLGSGTVVGGSGCNVINNINITYPAPAYAQGHCTCDNIKSFAINQGINWDLTSSTLAGDIATAMNNVLDLPTSVSASDVCAWMGTCWTMPAGGNTCLATGTPGYNTTTLANVPQVLSCPATNQPDIPDPCNADQQNADVAYGNGLMEQQAVNKALLDFRNYYTATCLSKLDQNEHMHASYQLNEYSYTLYYFDQAGNLIKTVPPEGVHPLQVSQTALSCNSTYNSMLYRTNPATYPFTWPAHTLVTNYDYNTLNQLAQQQTPDAGVSIFKYDAVGRLVVSQNARQAAYTPNPGYSYTVYDDLSRIAEVGEIITASPITSDITTSASSYSNWLAGSSPYATPTRQQITRTYYDEAPPLSIQGNNAMSIYASGLSGYLRNRVSCVAYFETNTAGIYTNASHYSYDIHGNVSTLYTDNPALATLGYDINRTDYDYDLISGKVNNVHYNAGLPDQLHHRYNYDADNRLTAVYSSRNNETWEKEAKYFYYKHGPLARVETGDKEVQASDYAYTIHGWIKGVNSNSLQRQNDPGLDAYNPSGGNLNRVFGSDAYGYTLGYFTGDYTAKNPSAVSFAASLSNVAGLVYPSSPSSSDIGASLYNGNISTMAASIFGSAAATTPQALLRSYRYDQLNRIKSASAYSGFDASGNAWGTSVVSTFGTTYKEAFTYDLNGNITQASRYNQAGTLTDQLAYNYYAPSVSCPAAGNALASNKLYFVRDNSGYTTAGTDIKDQTAHSFTGGSPDADAGLNYNYDAIGNLTKDQSEDIANINWTVCGKIKTITRTASSTKPDLEYVYNAFGQRLMKMVKPHASLTDPTTYTTTCYMRDAQGNVMGTYEKKYVSGAYLLNLEEQDLYGSARLGMVKKELRVDNNADVINKALFNSSTDSWSAVSATISNDAYNRLQVAIASGAFGSGVNFSPSLSAGKTYEVSFDVDLGNANGEGIQAVVLDYSGTYITTATMNPVQGHNSYRFTTRQGSTTLKFQNANTSASAFNFYLDNIVVKEIGTGRTLGEKRYELSNHLGNVLTVISDKKVEVGSAGITDHYMPDIISSQDYYAFGAPLDNHGFSPAAKYRYGFNGKENDLDIDGTGEGAQDYGMRIYNPSLGKFLSVDPITKSYPMLTPYQFASNCPIFGVDRDGLELAGPIDAQHLIIGYVIASREKKNPSILDIYIATIKYMLNTMGEDMSDAVKKRYGGFVSGAIEMARADAKTDDYNKRLPNGETKNILNTYQKISGLAKMAEASGTIAKDVIDIGLLAVPAGEFELVAEKLSVNALKFSKSNKLIIRLADEEGVAYLNKQGAEASFFTGTAEEGEAAFMLIRPGADRATVLEEIIHHNQLLEYGEKYMTQNVAKIEIEAQNILLEIGKKEKWSSTTLGRIERAKVEWTKKLK